MPLLDMACPGCGSTLHTDEVDYPNPESGDYECTTCGEKLGDFTYGDLKDAYVDGDADVEETCV